MESPPEPPNATAFVDMAHQTSTTSLTLEPDEFRADLGEFELSNQQENELLQALWDMMSMMSDIGWRVDNVQLMLPALFEKAGQDSGKLLEQKISTQNEEGADHG